MQTRCLYPYAAEIETVMASLEGVVDVAAVLQDANSPSAAIVGYVTPVEAAATNVVMATCRARLPQYMCPSALVGLEVMPRLANGKVGDVQGCAYASLQAHNTGQTPQRVRPNVAGQSGRHATPRVCCHHSICGTSQCSGGGGAICLAGSSAP